MSDEGGAQPGTDQRGRIVRWLLPVLGSVVLMLGGLAAVEVSQSSFRAAVNVVSISLYAAMIVLYGVIAWRVRRWRQPALDATERRFRAASEAVLVGLGGAPIFFLALVLRALYVGDLGR